MLAEEQLKRLIKEALREELFKAHLTVHREENVPVAPTSKEIYTVKEAATYLSMAVPTLRVKYSKKTIVYIQEGRKILFKKAHLDEYLSKFTRR